MKRILAFIALACLAACATAPVPVSAPAPEPKSAPGAGDGGIVGTGARMECAEKRTSECNTPQ